MATQTGIHIPSLVVVPSFMLGTEIENYNVQPADPKVYRDGPTLAVLRHAFYGKKPDGSWVSPEYRADVHANRRRGEWSSTFLRNGKEDVEMPEKVYFDKASGLWVAEGGKVDKVELPPDGWAVEYDKPTGWPSRTSSNRKDAEREFGGDASYFVATRNGLRAVFRGHYLRDDGPFSVSANWVPDDGFPNVGVRSSRRLEQGAEHLATPAVGLSQEEIETMRTAYRMLEPIMKKLAEQ